MQADTFSELISTITVLISDKPLDAALERDLNARIPPGSPKFQHVFDACRAGIEAGWMCNREASGIKYGRVVNAGPATHGFSIDVVDMNDIAGPHHVHPNGEIDLVMPLTENAKFDGRGAGWRVYGPGSAHSPTVTEGRALVLYLLPQGSIEFSKSRRE
jgi:hypothetical protein